MRDEMDARIWTAHHNLFSSSIESGAGRLARKIRDIDFGRAPAAHFIAAVLATSLTLVTVSLTNV